MKVYSFRLRGHRRKKKQKASLPLGSIFKGNSKREKKHLRWGKLFPKLTGNKRDFIFVGCIALLIALLFPLASAGKTVVTSASKRDLPIYCVEKDSKVVALSFDAAWGNEDTQQLIDILGKYDIQATFFVVGEWVDKYPESVKALHDAGHEIMNHSNSHAHFPKLSSDEIITDLNTCNDKIESITGVRPHLFRPPYGDYNDKVVSTARQAGMYTVQWDVDSLDWKDLSAKQITKRVLERTCPGSIVLFHNAAKNTPEALPDVIEGLIQKGYGFLPISKLILTDNYEIDHSGKQCPIRN